MPISYPLRKLKKNIYKKLSAEKWRNWKSFNTVRKMLPGTLYTFMVFLTKRVFSHISTFWKLWSQTRRERLKILKKKKHLFAFLRTWETRRFLISRLHIVTKLVKRQYTWEKKSFARKRTGKRLRQENDSRQDFRHEKHLSFIPFYQPFWSWMRQIWRGVGCCFSLSHQWREQPCTAPVPA